MKKKSKKKSPPKDKLYLIAYPIFRLRSIKVEEQVRIDEVTYSKKVPIFLGESKTLVGMASIRPGMGRYKNIYFADMHITNISNSILSKLSSPLYEFQPALYVKRKDDGAKARIKEILLSKQMFNRNRLMLEVSAPVEYAETLEPVDSN